MKTAAVICEYNPFHYGHKYQLDKTREMGATHIVAVMSGNSLSAATRRYLINTREQERRWKTAQTLCWSFRQGSAFRRRRASHEAR